MVINKNDGIYFTWSFCVFCFRKTEGVGSIKCGHLDEGVFVVFFFICFFRWGERRRGWWDGEGWWAPVTAAAPSLSTETVHVPSPSWPVLIPARVPSRYSHSWGKTQTTLLQEDNLTAAVGFSRVFFSVAAFVTFGVLHPPVLGTFSVPTLK